ncbi:MAG: hypothetical protein J6K82_03065 [Alphaproteobacteria bacterium]|nr:hypothetical protein [Alphaproteobacteria bacterium]
MLKSHAYTYIPDNYSDVLSELKGRSFQWEMNFSSRTENKTIGHISHYAIGSDAATNCLILIPGLGSNTRTEPLMKVVAYWALKNHHDVYCLDTFLGDFLPNISQELAEKHTFSEYIDLIDTGLDIIEKDVKAKKYDYSCLIGHSAGATGTFEIYNKRISERKKLRFSASIMFAPYLTRSFTTYIHNFYKRNADKENFDEQVFLKSAIGICSPHEPMGVNGFQKVSVLPTIFNDVDSVDFRPDLMDRYGIPITLVAGGRDKKSPPEELRKKYNILRGGKNGNLWKFVVFKDSRHSFIDQYKDFGAILRLIQSQKRFAQRCGK